MEIITYSNFRQHLKAFMDAVFTSRSLLCVTCSNGKEVVVMSRADYKSIQETLYLLGSAKDAERLAKGIAEFEQSKGVAHDLMDK